MKIAGSYKFTKDERIPLTADELTVINTLLEAGDRAGYYVAYYEMTGNNEALLTAKIASFSEEVGGVAFVSNWLLQNDFRSSPIPYSGIYFLIHPH